MGLIRKTASVSTLGLVSFRSKKERLRRAEKAQARASLELAAEQAAGGRRRGRRKAARKARHAPAKVEEAAGLLDRAEDAIDA